MKKLLLLAASLVLFAVPSFGVTCAGGPQTVQVSATSALANYDLGGSVAAGCQEVLMIQGYISGGSATQELQVWNSTCGNGTLIYQIPVQVGAYVPPFKVYVPATDDWCVTFGNFATGQTEYLNITHGQFAIYANAAQTSTF